jgi:hypothetical protein
MSKDKSFFYYGALYHRLFDRQLAEARQVAVDRIAEGAFGRDHYRNFKDFLAAGGLRGVLEESGLPISVEHSVVFWEDCREVVMVSTQWEDRFRCDNDVRTDLLRSPPDRRMKPTA